MVLIMQFQKFLNILKEDPGLEFDRLRWRNRRGRLDGSLEILYRNSLKTENKWFVQINGGIKEKVLLEV